MTAPRVHGLPGRSGPPGNRNAVKHGHWTRVRDAKERGLRAIDRRTAEGQDATGFHLAIVDHMGGDDQITLPQRELAELVTVTRWLRRSVESYLVELGTVVNRRNRGVLPVARELLRIIGAEADLLEKIGLERRQAEPIKLDDYLRERVRGAHPAPVIDTLPEAQPDTPAGGDDAAEDGGDA